ncbi:MAG: hypothetical protein B9S36_03780 [Verrucomicrobiia bacterium Tous-C2TDCM]|nr:MAG: hypothetical protein B9S36_03780 [Verrucomicrobiae bacterium Tous-C2TDCM]
MFLRRALSLFLIGIGIGSPWLVRDWLAARSQGAVVGGGMAGEPAWVKRWQNRFRHEKGGGAVSPALGLEHGEATVSGKGDERQPYLFASETKRIMEGFLGGGVGSERGGLKRWFPSGDGPPATPRSRAIVEEVIRRLGDELASTGLKPGDPLFLRVFKEESELEVWMKPASEPHYVLFKVHRLVAAAGRSGPKLREGDGQAPEGFYTFGPEALRPETRHHLGIDLGYPNAYDRQRGRTGSDLLIHGGSLAGGSYALPPAAMDEVYALADAAFRAGEEEVAVHLFPFRLVDARMDKVCSNPSRWTDEWVNLKEGYDFFENVRLPPGIGLDGDRYEFFIASGEN